VSTDGSSAKGFANENDDSTKHETATIKNAANSNDLNQAEQTLQSGTILSCFSLLLLITGASLTFPHLQSRRDALGCDSLCYGSMTSVRGALGLIGTSLMGTLSDKNGSFLALTLGKIGFGAAAPSGRRACLYIGTMASLIGLAIAASVDSLVGLWLSMIPGALLQHNFDVFKALVSEYHNDIDAMHSKKNDEKLDSDTSTTNQSSTSRSGTVGKLGMSAGISFMIGPMVAAVLSPSFQSATYLAIACTIASGIVIYRVPLPISTVNPNAKSTNSTAEKDEPSQTKKSDFTIINMIKLQTSTSRAAMTLLVIRLNMALAFHIFNTIWPSSLKTRFQFGPSDHARFMSFIGVTYAFSQGILAKKTIKLFGPNGKVYVIMICCAILGVGRYIAFYTPSIRVVYVSFLFIINALGILNTVITADIGSIAPSNELGGLFGILQSAESAAGMIGPFLGGVVSHYFGDFDDVISAPLLAIVGIYTFLFFFVLWGYDKLILACVRGPLNHDVSDVDQKKSM
jgi:DHA1 family tetracycline resistance protein-like MFS transporter